MRPSPRLLWIAGFALALAAAGVALGGGARDWAGLLWAMLALALAADVMLSGPRGIAVEVSAPDEVFTGETAALSLRAAAPGPLGVRVDWPEGLEGPEDAVLERDDGAAAGRLPLTARRRGTWRIERLWFRRPSRLGLVEFTRRVPLDVTVAVVPDIRPVRSGSIDAKVRTALFGMKENLAIGEGSEFHQLRDFVPGMDIRSIDWKRSAARRELLAKEMRAERNHHVILALDNGHLMRERVDGLSKIDHAVHAALALAWAAGLGGDLVGLFAYDAEPRLFLPPERGRQAFARLRSRTAELVYTSVESNHTLAMSTLYARTPRRSLIVVFSDFVDATTAELLVENVAVLSRRHVVVFVALADPGLETLAATSSDGMEGVARAVTAGQMLRERRLVMERLSRLGVTVIDVPPRAVTARLVSAYLEIKGRELL